jgi:hypothetical protein
MSAEDEHRVDGPPPCCASAEIHAIQSLKHKYARLDDSGYGPALVSLFADDAVWESNLSGRNEGREEIAALFARASTRYPWAVHIMANAEIEINDNGTEASARWVLLQLAAVPSAGSDKPEGLDFVVGVGRYEDLLVKQGGAGTSDTFGYPLSVCPPPSVSSPAMRRAT